MGIFDKMKQKKQKEMFDRLIDEIEQLNENLEELNQKIEKLED